MLLDTLSALASALPDHLLDRLLDGGPTTVLPSFATLLGAAGRRGPVRLLPTLLATERARREQDARYRALARALPDVAVFLFDHDLRFLVAEGAALEAQGYRREAIEGRTLDEVMPPERAAALAPRYRAILAGAAMNFTWEAGERIYRVRGRAMRDEEGAIVAGLLVSRDITERQRADRALRASEERYRALVDAIPAVVTVLDRDGIYRFSGGGGLAKIGRRPEMVLGKSIFEVRRDRPDILDDVRRALAGEAVHSTREVNGLDWETRYAPLHDGEGNPAGALYVATDITARNRAESALRASEDRFRSAFEHAAIGMALIGLDGRFRRVNRATCALTGYSEQALLATTFQAITHPDDLGRDLDHVSALLAGEINEYQLEKRYRHRDGRDVWALLSVSLVRDERGMPLEMIAQIQDIDARKQAEEELRASEARLAHLAMHDPLSGLPNRRHLAESLGTALAQLQRGGPPVGLLLLDLDGFKAVNDTWGHEAGDCLLVTVADRLRAGLRGGDTAARLGGDEFAVLLAGADDQAAETVTARLVATLSRPVRIGATTVTVTASAGIGLAAAGDTPDDLLRRADRALYAAKRAGKNQFAIAAD